jgi:hypothetical protein
MEAARRRARTGMMAAAVAAGVAVATMTGVAPAHAGATQTWYTFESYSHPGWWTGGGAGFDYGLGYAHSGLGNAWVRGTTGWNSVNTNVNVHPKSDCVASAWLRLSSGLTDGYMSVRAWNGDVPGPVLNEVRLIGSGPANPAHGNYNLYSFPFNPGPHGEVLFYIGLWGNGHDNWIQADDVVVHCPVPYPV